MHLANRLEKLSRNVFADMDRAKAQASARGKDIIDLSLGSTDLPPAPQVIVALQEALQDTSTYGYLLHNDTRAFRRAVASWYTQRFGVPVDPESEVLSLIGSQEGTAHLPLAVLNPGDIALLLDPGYPSHSGGIHLAGGQVYTLPLRVENHFLPRLQEVPLSVLSKSRMLVLSYPHNPTTACAPLSFFQEAVAFCEKHGLILVHDFPYVDIVFEPGYQAPSVLQVDVDKKLAIEFFSFSKSYNMGGFRIGFAIGNPQLIQALKQVKTVVDFNQYRGILQGAICALQYPPREAIVTYQERRDVLVKALQDIGWQVPTPSATMYLWAKLPSPWEDSRQFCTQLVEATGVALSPGAGFGFMGEGYVRFALVHPVERLQETAARIGDFLRMNACN